jgi:hypothetical protein
LIHELMRSGLETLYSLNGQAFQGFLQFNGELRNPDAPFRQLPLVTHPRHTTLLSLNVSRSRKRYISLFWALSSLISPLYVVDDWERPQPGANQPHLGESDLQDSSSPLFSIYFGITKEEDNTTIERWQKDADGILIFVSPSFAIPSMHHDTECYRRAYSLPRLQPFLRSRSWTSSQVLRTHSILATSNSSSQIRIYLARPSHPSLRHSLRLFPSSGRMSSCF